MSRDSALRALAILIAVAWLLSAGLGIYYAWQVDQDTTANLNRSVQASNAEDMKGYLIDARNGMEAWGYTSGHYAVIFTTPQNDAARDYQAVTRMIDRLDKVEHQDQSSTSYQVAMDDIRGTIRDSEWRPYTHWTIHSTPFAVMWWFPWSGWAFAGGVWVLADILGGDW
jgi:uncharacterized membrane protein YdfJ with MMPL/SSD domain